MKSILLCCSAILAIHSPQNAAAAPIQLTSPDGRWSSASLPLIREPSATRWKRRAPRSFPTPRSASISAPPAKPLQAVGRSRTPRPAASTPPGNRSGENAPSSRIATAKPPSNSPAPAPPSTASPSPSAPMTTASPSATRSRQMPRESRPKPPATSPNTTSQATSPPGSTITNNTTSARTNSAPSRATANRS